MSKASGDYLKKDSDVSTLESLFAGSLSGVVARAVTAPLDTIKIRLQLQQTKNAQVPGTLVISRLLREEGVRALWKGNVPAEFLYVLYGAAQFTSYSALNHSFHEFQQHHGVELLKLTHAFFVGCATGIVSTMVTYPFDLLRTRLVAHEAKNFLSMTSIARQILRSQGVRGFYVGLQPSLFSLIAYSGLFFWTYSLARTATEALPVEQIWGVEALCGFGAGTTAKALSFPLDTIRKRVQIMRPDSVLSMLKQNWKEHSLRGFYKGFLVSLLKTAPTSAISVAVYERTIAFERKQRL